MDHKELMDYAVKASKQSYSPYSRFRVGAALLSPSGEVITGTNVENRSFGLTICAERSALTAAVTQGIREFEALAIYCPDADYPVAPCGACRQVISEFVSGDFPIYYRGGGGETVGMTMKELLPSDSLFELKEESRDTP